MPIISLANHKGGVAKTTSSVNIGAGLAMLKKRVLLVDLDAQANLTQSLGFESDNEMVYHALTSKINHLPILEVREYLDLAPAGIDLALAEMELISETGREYALKHLLEPLLDEYDYILIDCPPSLGLLTVNALTASNEVYIPLQAQYLAMKGLDKLVMIVEKIKKRINPTLSINGVFLTQYDQRIVLNRNVLEIVEQFFPDKLFKTKIRKNISLAEAPSAHQDIFQYAPDSKGAEDYMNLCKEIIKLHK